MTTFRTDGLDSPLSPNSGLLTWRTVEAAAEESAAVTSWDRDSSGMAICWCDGTNDNFAEPVSAYNAILAMSQS